MIAVVVVVVTIRILLSKGNVRWTRRRWNWGKERA